MKPTQAHYGLLLALIAAAIPANAQLPSGTDVSTAIPIYFGQTITDMGDIHTQPERVYSITLSKSQVVSATMTVPATQASAGISIGIWGPGALSFVGCGWNCNGGSVAAAANGNTHAVAFTYTASTSGVYYVKVGFNNVSTNYSLIVNYVSGPPPNTSTSSSCITGQVDYITYSIELIGAGLPDSVSINGQQLCATCTVKAPAYTPIVEKMESALAANVPVSACYDGSGNVVQITLKHP